MHSAAACASKPLPSFLAGAKPASFKPCRVPSFGVLLTQPQSQAASRRGGQAGRAAGRRLGSCVVAATAFPGGLQALIFDCDGVIVESEEIHRLAYCATFKHFDVRCPNNPDATVDWSVEYYDALQNTVGGGKPKMRHYFGLHGWPTTSVLGGRVAADDVEEALVIDTLQEWKTEKYKDIIGSGEVSARPGILRLMKEAQAAGIPVAVCSAATKAAVDFVLPSLLGKEQFEGLDLYMAGDDVKEKKPNPMIYQVAAQRLSVDPASCLVIEDSMVGLKAATGAGMRCLITYTNSTRSQEFPGADTVLFNLADVTFAELAAGQLAGKDDRLEPAAAAAAQ